MRGNSYLRIFAIVIGFVGVSLFCGTIRVYAAYDTFLKIEGLDAGSKDAGRSVDDKHKDWIVVTRVVSGDLNAEAMKLVGTWKFTPLMCNDQVAATMGDFVVHFQGR